MHSLTESTATSHTLGRMLERGAYPAGRAAALSGVPWSTVHEWARKDLVVPSISTERTRLWSYADLMGLRLVYWLRHPKPTATGQVRGVAMPEVRLALAALREMEQNLWAPGAKPVVAVDRSGKVVLDPSGNPEELSGQGLIANPELLNLVLPFESEHGIRGPDLIEPRPTLRIVPGKLGGEPHVARSRVETRALAALARRGMGSSNIVRLYPALGEAAVADAIDLENQLARNIGADVLPVAA